MIPGRRRKWQCEIDGLFPSVYGLRRSPPSVLSAVASVAHVH